MKPILISTIVFFFFSVQCLIAQDHLYRQHAEDYPTGDKNKGYVTFIQDSRVDTILHRHILYNQSQDGYDGYRVHIFFDAGNQSLSRATQAAKRYQMLYPEDTAYISFNEPYYHVHVGDFRTRLDAEGHQQKISKNYPNAFVIKDKINPPPID